MLSILIILLAKLKLSKSVECSSNCLYCKDETTCTRCETNYFLVGTSQFPLTNETNEITCKSSLTEAHFKTDNDIYYPCSNSDYGYLRTDTTKCFRKDVLGINYYYTKNYKNYYPCGDDDTADSITGIPNCNQCELKKDENDNYKLSCLNCKYGYAFHNSVKTACISVTLLSHDTTIFKYDENNYLDCSVIVNCFSCTSRHACTKCDTGYYLKNYERSVCYPLSVFTPTDEYFLDNWVYYSCGLNGGVSYCKRCQDKTTCLECLNDYTIVNDDSTKCYRISQLNKKLYYTHDNGKHYYSCINYDNTNDNNKHCLECDFSDATNFKCLKCDDDYYFLEDRGYECFKQSTITNEYYKYNNTLYKKCSNAIEGCQTCENSKKCLTCSNNDFGILDRNYSICQDISQGLSSNYIYQDEDLLYYTCEKEKGDIEGCLKCISKNECIETKTVEYCLLNSGSEVYKLNTSSDIYYHSNIVPRDDTCMQCNNIFTNCFLCNSQIECIQCDEGFALIEKSGCDYKAAYEVNDEYFSDDNFINFYKCDNTGLSSKAINNCKKCEYFLETSENKCIECNEDYIILDNNDLLCIYKTTSIQEQIDNNKIIPNELNTKYYTCNKLMENCDTCESMEICLTCKDNFAFLDDNKTICYSKDMFTNGHYYTNDGGLNFYSCIANCTLCEDSTYCIKCDNGFELNDFSTKCNLILKNDKDIKENCVYITNNINDDIDNIRSNINNYARNYWNLYKEEKNYLVKYVNQNANYTLLIFKNYQCSLYLYEEDKKFKIDTNTVIEELKKYIGNQEIIQAIFLYKNHTAINFFNNLDNGNLIDVNTICPSCLNKKYSIYYNYGNKLNSEIGPKFAEIIKENNIDIFNELDPYFQDFCLNLQISGIDMPLNQRLFLLYKGNLSYNLGDTSKGDLFACDMNCSLVNNNIEELISECQCDINYDINDIIYRAHETYEINKEIKIEKKDLSDEYNFLENSKDAFNMFTCSENAFLGSNIKSNPGFYITLIGMASQFIFFILLLCKPKLSSFAKLLILANPPKTQKTVNNKINDNDNKRTVQRITDNDYFLTQPEEVKNKYNYINKDTNTIVPTSTIPIKDISNSNSSSENEDDIDNGEVFHQRMNIYKGNDLNLNIEQDKNEEYDFYPIIKYIKFDVNVYRDIGYTYEQKDVKELKKNYKGIKMIKYNLLFKHEKNKILPLIYKPLLIDFLPYKYAQYYDKRSFLDLYKYFLCLRHPLINIFINENNISRNFIPFSVKAIKIIFCGMLILFFNSMLITQKYLFNKFNYFDEKFNFQKMQLNDDITYSEKIKYGITHNGGNSFATYLIVLVFDIVISLILSVRLRIKNLLDEFYEIDSGKNDVINKDKMQQKNFEKELLKVSDLKNIYIYTIIVFFAFFIMFFIYIINFCYSYKAENPDLFFSSLWSFLFYVSFPFLTNLIMSALRYLSLQKDSECVFNISKILIDI